MTAMHQWSLGGSCPTRQERERNEMLGALHYILSTAEVDADTKELEHRALVKIRLHTRALLAKIEEKP